MPPFLIFQIHLHLSDFLYEGVDRFGFGCPTGADTHCHVGVVNLLPWGEEELGGEAFALFCCEDWELLVGRAVDKELCAFLLQGFLDSHCFAYGMAGDVEVESVGEEGLKLDAEQTSFG